MSFNDKKIHIRWSLEFEEDVNRYHGMDIHQILAQQIAQELDQEIVDDLVAAWGRDRVVSNWIDDLRPGDLFYISDDPERPCIFVGYGCAQHWKNEVNVIVAARSDGVIEFMQFPHVRGKEIVLQSRWNEPAA